MSDNHLVKIVAGTCISFSFILVGNAINQSFMTIPALLVDFPKPGHPGYETRARLLGRQWPVYWSVGNNFFRPISTLGIFGYAYSSFMIYREGEVARGDWRLFAVAAAMHLTTVVHSALNMQPLNDKLESLASRANGKELANAEAVVRKWGEWNRLRLVTPAIAGVVALWNFVR